MGFKDVIEKIGRGSKERKELLKQIDQNVRMNKIIEDRQKSSNERELDRYMDEDREASIKEHLEFARKKRDDDIKFGHNPINAKNIMKAEWSVLKEKNQFAGKSDMLNGTESIMKDNPNLLRSNNKLLKSNNHLHKTGVLHNGGGMFKI